MGVANGADPCHTEVVTLRRHAPPSAEVARNPRPCRKNRHRCENGSSSSDVLNQGLTDHMGVTIPSPLSHLARSHLELGGPMS